MKDILLVLHKKGGAMSANEISKETGISYITVNKYLTQLIKKGVIIEHATKKVSKKSN